MTNTVIITGADKGLGLSLVKKFLIEGFHVFAGAYLSQVNLDPLDKSFPHMLTIVPLDVTDVSSVRHAVDIISRHVSELDILVNNAGIHPPGAKLPLEELDIEGRVLEKTMDVNAFGPLRVTQQVLPLLRRGKLKRIINISSESGSIADCTHPSWFPYCMSKAALNMQSKILQNYLSPDGFKVFAFHPGWMRTDMGGMEGPIHPDEAAVGIYKLAMQDWKPDDPIFMDYKGNVRSW